MLSQLTLEASTRRKREIENNKRAAHLISLANLRPLSCPINQPSMVKTMSSITSETNFVQTNIAQETQNSQGTGCFQEGDLPIVKEATNGEQSESRQSGAE